MNKVITINLNGRAYQLEEAGYETLQKYLNHASKNLGENPDQEEIMNDFEQAIADKCSEYLNAHKTVVTSDEIEEIIKKMGPVDESDKKKQENTDRKTEASNETDKETSEKSNTSAPKRLYQIREGAMVSGVCTGIAAYFNIDVTIVRILFVVLTILTQGALILVYFAMMVIVPYANTSEEKAAAHGLPFNAKKLIERAREKYAHMDHEYWEKKGDEWKKWGKQQGKDWKNRWEKNKIRHEAHVKRMHMAHNTNQPTNFVRVTNGFSLTVAVILMIIISIIWIAAVISLLTTGALFGVVFTGIPLWVVIVLMTCAYNILLMPVRLLKASSYQTFGPNQYMYDTGWFGILDAIMWFTFIGFAGWAVWTYVPQSHVIWEKISDRLHLNSEQVEEANPINTQMYYSTQSGTQSQQINGIPKSDQNTEIDPTSTNLAS